MKPGKKVICVNDKFSEEKLKLIPNRPIDGVIYTVRKKLITRNGPALLLDEILNPYLNLTETSTFEPSFHISRFRELDELYNVIEQVEVEEYSY